MAIIEVAGNGELTILRLVPTAPDAHCVAVDELGNAYVCDPANGRLLVVHDEPSP
jgi:hypothetical protein